MKETVLHITICVVPCANSVARETGCSHFDFTQGFGVSQRPGTVRLELLKLASTMRGCERLRCTLAQVIAAQSGKQATRFLTDRTTNLLFVFPTQHNHHGCRTGMCLTCFQNKTPEAKNDSNGTVAWKRKLGGQFTCSRNTLAQQATWPIELMAHHDVVLCYLQNYCQALES
jgi:hypothetical protein